MSKQKDRVDTPIAMVQGPLVGETLLDNFKNEIMKERLFQIMFGIQGERIFVKNHPNLNEEILPALLLDWKQETFNSGRTMFEGTISAMLAMPVRLEGDTNALRRVGSMIQRWMSGSMNLMDPAGDNFVAGLIKFGYGALYDYAGLAQFSGLSVPVIQINIPFSFDLELLRLLTPGTDFEAALDDSDVSWLTDTLVQFVDTDSTQVINQEEITNG